MRYFCLYIALRLLTFSSFECHGQIPPNSSECQKVEEQLYFNTTLEKSQVVAMYLDSLKRCGQDDVSILLGVAKYLYSVKEIIESDAILQSVRKLNDESVEPNRGEIAYYQGLIAYSLKNYDAGIDFFTESLDAGFNHAFVFNGIGQILMDIGQQDDALNYFVASSKLEPGIISNHYYLGKYYKSKHLYQKALFHLLLVDSLSAGTWLDSQVQLISTLQSLRKYDEAYFKAEELVSKFPSSKVAIYNLGYTAAYLGKRQIAFNVINRFKKQGLRTADDYFDVGFLYDSTGTLDSAAFYYSVCLNINPKNLAALTNLGIIYKQKGLFNLAHSYFDRVLEIDPKEHYALNMKVQTYMWEFSFENCLSWNNKLDSLYPDNHGSYLMKGYILLLLKRYDEAIPWLEKQIVYDKNDNRAWNNLGACYTGLGQYEEAEHHFIKALELNPNNSYTYHNRALLYQKQGLYNMACVDLEKAIELEYTWLIDSALITMQQLHCPDVIINRKVNLYVYKGNEKSKQHLSFIELVDSLAYKEFENIPDQEEILPKEISTGFEIANSKPIIFPNPTNGQITVQSSNSSESSYIKVFNINGVVVYSSMMIGQRQSYDLGQLGAGTYVILFYSNSNIVSSQKLVII